MYCILYKYLGDGQKKIRGRRRGEECGKLYSCCLPFPFFVVFLVVAHSAL